MLETTRWRKDGRSDQSGSMKMIWAWRLYDKGLQIREGMLALYSLTPHEGRDPDIYAMGLTHEFQVFEIDPETPIDFEESLFEQPGLSPLLPSRVAYQFRAKSAGEASDRIGDLVQRVASGELPPDIASEWAPFLRDAVDISSHQVDPEDLQERLAVAKVEDGRVTPGARGLKARYEFVKAPTPRQRAGFAFSLLLGGALLSTAAAALLAPSPDEVFYWLKVWDGQPFFTETETPDGTIYQSTIQAVPGHLHRYRLVTRTKLETGLMPGADLQVRLAQRKSDKD